MPMVVHCPVCGFAGESRDPEDVFYLGVGTLPNGSRAKVRECRSCGTVFARKAGLFGFLHRWGTVQSERSQRSPYADEYYQPPVRPDARRKPLAKLAEAEEEVRRRNEQDR
jgi:hypothetical protein